jgi:hypothetical protein
MITNRRALLSSAFSALILAGLAVSACGQSTTSYSIVGWGNSTQSGGDGGIHSASFNSATDGSAVTASVSNAQFTGMDGAGNTQTMTFSGTAYTQSNFGQIHSSTSMSVANTYYNQNNTPYYNSQGQANAAGSPDNVDSLSIGYFTDVLQFGGALQAGYQARYIFHIDGDITGNITEPNGALADMGVQIANNPDQLFFAYGNGPYTADWVTNTYEINGVDPQTINVEFSTQAFVDTWAYPDGSNIGGSTDFQNTLTLAGIEVVNQYGQDVTGWTVSSASGTQYTQLHTVPGPSSAFTIMALGVSTIARRRKQNRHSA